MCEHFFYHDLAGRRRLRWWVWAAIASLAVLLTVAGTAFAVLSAERAARFAPTPTPLPPPTATPTPTPLPPPTATPTPAPTPTREEACPSDPARWSLRKLVGFEHRYILEPKCVYEGLERAVAFYLLTADGGWTPPEAAEALGLPQPPIRFHPVITVATHVGAGRQRKVELTRIPFSWLCLEDGRCGRGWIVPKDPQPSPYAFPLGCFRTRDEFGGWGMPYPIVCGVGYDLPPRRSYSETPDGLRIRRELDRWYRDEVYFGYDPARRMWFVIGVEGNTAPPEIVAEGGRTTAETPAKLHGLPVWDWGWVQRAYGLGPKPMPVPPEQWPNQEEEFRKAWTFERGVELMRRAWGGE